VGRVKEQKELPNDSKAKALVVKLLFCIIKCWYIKELVVQEDFRIIVNAQSPVLAEESILISPFMG
jgi:hypothetical protein